MEILFICTGNASRSAAAEAVLKKLLGDNGITDVEVSSCGTDVPEGLDRSEIMGRIAAEHGYEMGGKAIPMNEDILDRADLIIVMTEGHRNEVTRILCHDHWNRIVRFNDYCFGEPTDLPDPYFQTEYVYRTCFDRIEAGCREIVNKLR